MAVDIAICFLLLVVVNAFSRVIYTMGILYFCVGWLAMTMMWVGVVMIDRQSLLLRWFHGDRTYI